MKGKAEKKKAKAIDMRLEAVEKVSRDERRDVQAQMLWKKARKENAEVAARAIHVIPVQKSGKRPGT